MVKTFWFFTLIALCLALAIVIGKISNPIGLTVANKPPEWDFPTTEFSTKQHERIWLDLSDAFFDPDGDVLEFNAVPDKGIKLILKEEGKLTIVPFNSGNVWIEAWDGKAKTVKRITITVHD